MLPSNRTLLKIVINKEFGKGINKVNLFIAIEEFIDLHYPPVDTRHNRRQLNRTEILNQLVHDIQKAGGLQEWKIGIQGPVVGSFPFKKKKQSQYQSD